MTPSSMVAALAAVQARLAEVPDKDAMLACLFGLAPFPLQVYDRTGRSILVNQAFRDLYRTEPPPHYCIFDDKILEAGGFLVLVHRAFAGEVIELPALWYDPSALGIPGTEGSKRAAISTTLFPLFDALGAVSHVVIVARDETEAMGARERLECERNAAQKARQEAEAARAEAERASRTKDEFLAMLGHELRNPLAPIATALHLARLRGSLTAREQEVIERQVQHLSRLVDDLLDVSRLAQGKVKMDRKPLELGRAIARAIEMASPLLDECQHHLTRQVPQQGLLVNGDEGRLAQVFANLLTNAARYTPSGGQLGIRAKNTGDAIEVQVSDDGTGIAPDLLPHIWESFIQGARSSPREGGLGLGLALVRSFVTLHGGQVEAQSAGPGKGSTFIITLPACQTDDVIAVAVASPNLTSTPTPRKVLIVDDNADAAEMLAEYARMRGYEVATAGDGPEALRLAETFKPDVALLDIGLPMMDGFELAGNLQATLGAEVPLFALTGYGQDQDRERSAAAGFCRHFVKPVGIDEVMQAIAEVTS